MKKLYNVVIIILFFIYVFGIFYHWFLNSAIIGGDWPYYLPQFLKTFTFPPLAWVPWKGNGLGGIDVTYSLHIYENFTVLIATIFHISWVIVYKIFWFGLFLLLSIFSVYFLYRLLFPKSVLWQRLVAAGIYITNTYILLVASGGQMGYALGYSLLPTVIALFIRTNTILDTKKRIKNIILTSLSLAGLVMLDIRVAYLVLIAVSFYYIFLCIQQLKKLLHVVLYFCIPVIIAFLLNSSWILPLVLFKQNPVSEVSVGYESVSSLKFFSFADFSHSLALLHPNWPENIFGKIYFLQPEFLIIPILVFASLLFINKHKTRGFKIDRIEKINVLFFAMLGLIGIFLAKGVNDPFGFIYTFLFQHVPGFVMFRDPTKFYTYIVLSYAILIPFSLKSIASRLLNNKYIVIQKNLQNIYYGIVLAIFCIFWIFTVRQAVSGHLGGTFQKHTVPEDYYSVASYLDNQPEFFRTLWFPKQSRFSYTSANHPLIEASPFFNATSSSELINKIKQPQTQHILQDISVRYIIVPYDSLGEIFLKDRKYNAKEYRHDIAVLQQIPWLKQINLSKRIMLFQLSKSKDHFYLEKEGTLKYSSINSTKYTVHIHTLISNNLIFSENYNNSWAAMVNGKEIHPVKMTNGLISFILPQKGTYDLTIMFVQQQYYISGFIFSLLVFVFLIIALIMLK